jgi:hypothetical protein
VLFALACLRIGGKSAQLVRVPSKPFGDHQTRSSGRTLLTAIGLHLRRVLRWNNWAKFNHPNDLAHMMLRTPPEWVESASGSPASIRLAGAF